MVKGGAAQPPCGRFGAQVRDGGKTATTIVGLAFATPFC
jgi:hypothetical protein